MTSLNVTSDATEGYKCHTLDSPYCPWLLLVNKEKAISKGGIVPDVRVEVRNCRGIVDVEKERKKGIEASLAHGFHIEGVKNQVRLIELQLQLEVFQRWWWQQVMSSKL